MILASRKMDILTLGVFVIPWWMSSHLTPQKSHIPVLEVLLILACVNAWVKCSSAMLVNIKLNINVI